MNALFRQTLRGSVVAAALVLACTPPSTPASGRAEPPPEPKAPSGKPSIVGTVSLLSTGKPPTTGGVVYLEDAPKKPGLADAATVDVYRKSFFPFIAVVTTGGTVTFGNREGLAHHVFSPDIDKWDTGFLQKDETAGRSFDKPGPVALLCNIHPEMLGYILVIPSSYYGKIGAEGEYVIADVPPGNYNATAWAPRLPTVTMPVTVGGGDAASLDFDLKPAAAGN